MAATMCDFAGTENGEIYTEMYTVSAAELCGALFEDFDTTRTDAT